TQSNREAILNISNFIWEVGPSIDQSSTSHIKIPYKFNITDWSTVSSVHLRLSLQYFPDGARNCQTNVIFSVASPLPALDPTTFHPAQTSPPFEIRVRVN